MNRNRLALFGRVAVIALAVLLVLPLATALAETPDAQNGVTATTTVNLRIRSGPGTNFSQIGLLSTGTTVSVVGRNEAANWLLIDHQGTRGWVAAWYTVVSGDLNSVPVSAESGAAAPTASTGVTATTTVNLRVRSGPSTDFGQVGLLARGTTVNVLNRNADSSWLYMDRNGLRGWIAAWYTVVSGDLANVPLPGGAAPTAAPQPAAPPPSAALPPIGSFNLGGQTHDLRHPDAMRSAGMTWVKFQQKWTPGQDPAEVAGRIQLAHSQGFRVLISITGPLYPSSIDFNSFTNYVGGVAGYGADAIEIWNEMNLDREWPAGQVSPTSYVNNMLAPSFRAIKQANPNTMVILGALAPTGVNQGNTIWSDDRYLAGLRDAGAAQYMDCLGVHHNAGATSPDAVTGHPAAPGGGHYSWYFGPTFNLYAGTFPNTPLCYTELGYVSPQGYPPIAPNFSWGAGNTVAQQAEWLGRAAQILRHSGRTKLMIVFNVDIMVYLPDDPQGGYAIIRPDGSCPACGPLAAAVR